MNFISLRAPARALERCALLLIALLGTARLWGGAGLPETRSTLEKWVETRSLISKTRSDWQSDKEMLEQTTQVLERELKAVEEQMTKVGTNSVQVEKERAQTEELLKSSNENVEQAKQFSASIEGKITKLIPRLPVPLQEIVKPLLQRVPADPATTKMAAAERVQVIVGLLNEIDKFNNAVSVFSEKRKNEKGDEIAVETLYVGLGAAYFVNDTGDFAGMGTPGSSGWEWTVKSEIAGPVKEVVRIYRNEKPAKFVPLPAVIR